MQAVDCEDCQHEDTRTATSIFALLTPGALDCCRLLQTSHSSLFAVTRTILSCVLCHNAGCWRGRDQQQLGGSSNYLVCPRLRLARLELSRSWSPPPASRTPHYPACKGEAKRPRWKFILPRQWPWPDSEDTVQLWWTSHFNLMSWDCLETFL